MWPKIGLGLKDVKNLKEGEETWPKMWSKMGPGLDEEVKDRSTKTPIVKDLRWGDSESSSQID